MKIRVTTEGKSMAIDLEREQARKVFNAIVLQLLKADGILPADGPPRADRPKEEEPKEEAKEEPEQPVLKEPAEQKPYKKLQGLHAYKGFLYIRCPECGTVKGFCTKELQEGCHCFECGADIPFTEELVPLYVNCQCGRYFRYMTNMSDEVFDINCIDCGSPVAVQYNAKKKIYETIQES